MVLCIDGEALEYVCQPSSIMDLGTTLCGLTGAIAPLLSEGVDFSPWLLRGQQVKAGSVYSEFFDRTADGRETIGVMVRQGNLKYISYTGWEEEDMLFDLDADPGESHNVIGSHPLAEQLRGLARKAQEERLPFLKLWHEQQRNAAYLAKWGRNYRDQDTALWVPPVEVRTLSEKYKRSYGRNG